MMCTALTEIIYVISIVLLNNTRETLYFRFKNMELLKRAVLDKVSKDDKLNYGLDRLMLVTDTVYSLLAKGLGDRVHLILQMVEADFTWPVKKVLSAAKTESW